MQHRLLITPFLLGAEQVIINLDIHSMCIEVLSELRSCQDFGLAWHALSKSCLSS